MWSPTVHCNPWPDAITVGVQCGFEKTGCIVARLRLCNGSWLTLLKHLPSITSLSLCQYEEIPGSSMIRRQLSSTCLQLYIAACPVRQCQGRWWAKERSALPHAACGIASSWRSSHRSTVFSVPQGTPGSLSQARDQKAGRRPSRILRVPSLYLYI